MTHEDDFRSRSLVVVNVCHDHLCPVLDKLQTNGTPNTRGPTSHHCCTAFHPHGKENSLTNQMQVLPQQGFIFRCTCEKYTISKLLGNFHRLWMVLSDWPPSTDPKPNMSANIIALSKLDCRVMMSLTIPFSDKFLDGKVVLSPFRG